MPRPQLGANPATPTPIAFGDTASVGASGDNAALATHRHAAPDNPVTNALLYGLKSGFNISGGGTVSVDASGYVKNSSRFIIMANGRGSDVATTGYYDVNIPTSGTITGVGGATNKTATAAGVPLDNWDALYYILPLGSSSASVAANFRVANYTATPLVVPSDWVLIAIRNGDSPVTFKICNGMVLGLGQSLNVGDQDPTFATPTITLGTTAAAGSAKSVIRSDATIAAFDATTPAALGASAATGSAAFAARRDHVHLDPTIAHAAAADPHTGYQKESEKNANNGYLGLGSTGFAAEPWRESGWYATMENRAAAATWTKIASGSLTATYDSNVVDFVMETASLNSTLANRKFGRARVTIGLGGTYPATPTYIDVQIIDGNLDTSDLMLVTTSTAGPVTWELHLYQRAAWDRTLIRPLITYGRNATIPTWHTNQAGGNTATAVSIANPSQITCAAAHNLTTGQTVTLSGFSTTPDINGSQVVTVVSSTVFSIPVNVTAVTTATGTIVIPLPSGTQTTPVFASLDSVTPSAVGTSGSAGTSIISARRDHVHAHEAAHINHDTTWAAKGDLIVGTADNTAAILTKGADDTILMADSAAGTGLKWVASATPVAVGTSNSAGTSDDFARGSHVHAHEAAHVAHDTIWDAKGDIVTGSANDTAVKTSIGSDDTILMADSSASGGVKWVASGTPVSIGNTNSDGTSDTYARGDHVHSTGVRELTLFASSTDVTSSGAYGTTSFYGLFGSSMNNFKVPANGRVKSINARISSARTGGAMEFFVYNATTGQSSSIKAVIDGTNTVASSDYLATPIDTFSAGDNLQLAGFVSSGTFAPITADVYVVAVISLEF